MADGNGLANTISKEWDDLNMLEYNRRARARTY